MRKYTNLMPHADFPIGGIGTGTVTLRATGELNDFQLFNQPSLGVKIPYTFFSMYTKWDGKSDARALEAEYGDDFYKGRGMHPAWTMGLPRFKKSKMQVKYPFAQVEFEDEALPVQARMTAFNPFIPMNADDSGIPGIIFHIDVENPSAHEAEVLIALSMGNIHNYSGGDCFDNPHISPALENCAVKEDGIAGVFMTGSAVDGDHRRYANNAILSPDAGAEVRRMWYRGGWYDGIMDFWTNFKAGKLEAAEEDDGEKFSVVGPAACIVGSVGVRKTIAPGAKERFTFVMSWYVPNRVKGWFEEDNGGKTMKNHYANLYADALAAGSDLIRRGEELEKASRLFSDAIHDVSLPEPILDAAISNIAVLRSTTCFRGPDGCFHSWEGSHENVGSCVGTCTHVWNYAQTVAFLFPELEKSARMNEFLVETSPEGKMTFRTQRRFGMEDWGMYPATDGQYGTIMRAWREWKMTGDIEYLKTIYPMVLKAFDFGITEWDQDGDGVPEASQHNTYDIEFYGPNPLSTVMQLGATRAVQAMAAELGDDKRAEEMAALFEKTQKRFEELCWQGEYYVQRLDDVDKYPYQFGVGCLSDQLFGQTLAYICGFGKLLDADHLKSAAAAIFKYNFLEGKDRNICLQRLYVADDEPGLVICSWPEGGIPRFPFVYSDEVWTGIEYQVATTMIYEDMIDDAVKLVKAVRDRFDGQRRAPWNEMECGFYYTRAMASWGLLVAMEGFECDVAHGEIAFAPKPGVDKMFWSMGGVWGSAEMGESFELRPLYGEVCLKKITLPNAEKASEVLLNGEKVEFTAENGAVKADVSIKAGDVLSIRF